MAAGRGKRLGPLTRDRSKALVPVAGEPMIGRVIKMLVDGGCDRLVVVVNRDDEALVRYLLGGRWAARAWLAFQDERLGMAHAVQCAGPLIREDGRSEFVLASCDNVYPDGHVARLVQRRRQERLDAALTLMRVTAKQIPTLAVVAMENGLVGAIVEKPRPEDAPSDLGVPSLYALSKHVLDYLPHVPISGRGEREFPDALRLLIEDGGRVGGELIESRLTLTRPIDLLELTRHYLHRDPSCAVIAREMPGDVTIVPPVRIEHEAILGAGCTIGPEVVLADGCRVGQRAIVRRSVVQRGASVAAGTVVDGAVLV